MQQKFVALLIGIIYIDLVSGQFPFRNEEPGAFAGASAQAGGGSAQASAGVNNYQNMPPGRQPPAFSNPNMNRRMPPRYFPPPNDPMNPANGFRRPPPQQNNSPFPMNPVNNFFRPYPNPHNNGQNNAPFPMNPANRFFRPPPQLNNKGQNNDPFFMNPANRFFRPPPQLNNKGQNNVPFPMNRFLQAPSQPNNNRQNNSPFPGHQQSSTNNYPLRPNMRDRLGNPESLNPRRGNLRRTEDTNTNPQNENFQPNTDLPVKIPNLYPTEELPKDFVTNMLAGLGLTASGKPINEEPTELNEPLTTEEGIPPAVGRRMKNPYRRGRRRHPKYRLKKEPLALNSTSLLMLTETTLDHESTPETVTNGDFSVENSSEAVELTTPTINSDTINSYTSVKNTELFTTKASMSSSGESSIVTNPSTLETTSQRSNKIEVKPGETEFIPVLLKSPSGGKTVSATESAFLPKTTCYCTDGVTYVTTENLINIKKATTPLYTVEEAYTKYSDVPNNGFTTLSYTDANPDQLTSAAITKKTGDNGEVTKSDGIALTSTAAPQDTTASSGSTQENSVTFEPTPSTDDLELTTISWSATSVEITTEASEQTTLNKDHSDLNGEEDNTGTSTTFDENYYVTAVPPPGVECREKERYYKCVPNCRHTCFNFDNYDVPCPEFCLSGCFCDPGLVVDENGKCVETSQCKDYSCKEDEDWWDCIPKNHTCKKFGKAEAKEDFECDSGCFCMDGLIQDKDGSCVEPGDCSEPVCGDNEGATDCINVCNSCEANCRSCSFFECTPGCDCKDGFKRASNGTCIQANKCPDCTSPPPKTSSTTTVPPKIENTSVLPKVETTTESPKDETTVVSSKAVTTAISPKDETTVISQNNGTTAIPPKYETAAISSKDQTTVVSINDETTVISPKAKTTVVSTKDETTTFSSKSETTAIPKNVDSSTILKSKELAPTITPVKITAESLATTTEINSK